MSIIIVLWSMFSMGSFNPEIIPSHFQYIAILSTIIAITAFKLKLSEFKLPLLGYLIWIFYAFAVRIFNEGEVLFGIEKTVLYIFTLFGYFCIAKNYKRSCIIESIMLGGLGLSIASAIAIFVLPSLSLEQGVFQGYWKGIFEQKNTLGRVCTICVFCASYLIFSGEMLYKKRWYYTILILSFIVCYKTGSRTSVIISIISVIWFFSIFKLVKIQELSVLNVKKIFIAAFFALTVVFFIAAFFVVQPYGLHGSADGIQIFGFRIALTGRLTIWYYAISNLFEEKMMLWGYGIDNFWTIENKIKHGNMINMGGYYPHDSHNGLVDLFVQVGVVGALIYLVGLFTPLFLKNKHFTDLGGVLIFFSVMIFFVYSNITESYVTKSTNIINAIMIIFWFKMFNYNVSDNKDVSAHNGYSRYANINSKAKDAK